jgi:hypothetical protein
MDRLPRTVSALGLGLLLTAPGCRSTRPEVPPGRPFANDGKQRKAIEFSSEPPPINAAASTNFMPGNTGGSNLAAGIGSKANRPDATAFGAPPGAYGPPGSSVLGQPPALDQPPVDPAAMPAATSEPPAPAGSPPVGLPPEAELNLTPPSLATPPPTQAAPPPSQVIQPPMDIPGVMGRPDQVPSPN